MQSEKHKKKKKMTNQNCKLINVILLIITIGISTSFTKSLFGQKSEVKNSHRTVKVAAAQILTDYNIENNEEKICNSIKEAHAIGCDIIVFHEGCLTGYPDEKTIKQIDFSKVREAEKRICNLSKEYNIAILLGSTSEENGKYYNYVLIVNENGKVLGLYHKTWRAGERHYEAGSGPVIFTVAGVEATVIICHDLRYPELARLGVAAGAKIVFIANNESGIIHENKLLGYRSMQIARATENMVYAVMCNSPADPKDVTRRNCSHGNSNIVDPLGNVIDEATSFEERLVVGILDLDKADRSTVLRTIGQNEKTNKYYRIECENTEYKRWVMEGLKLVRRLDGENIPTHLTNLD